MFKQSSNFDRLLEKSTSQLLLEPDWDAILQICDSIRQGDVTPKYAIAAMQKKTTHDNPNIQMLALTVIEAVVKNCGAPVHAQIATRAFMDFFQEIARTSKDPVKTKVLELIQTWSHAFREEAAFKVIVDTYHLMKHEGHSFPVLKEADAMFMADSAPEWKDGEVCHRCRVQFSMVVRKHHCRNCGQIFCSKCSSKTCPLPRYGIEREVRVCDVCFDKVTKSPRNGKEKQSDLPSEYLASPLSKQQQKPAKKTEEEIKEEEELQLAIAISQSEAEKGNKKKTSDDADLELAIAMSKKEHEKSEKKPSTVAPPTSTVTTSAVTVPSALPPSAPSPSVSSVSDGLDMDPELAKYLNRSYWENKNGATTTAVKTSLANETESVPPSVMTEKLQNGDSGLSASDGDKEKFLEALRSSIEIFVNRMSSNSARGRPISNDSSVQTLFLSLSQMHPQLLQHIQDQEESRSHYEMLQDKLAQLKDAREALNALRQEEEERRRREAAEVERQRQIAMAQKLEVLRQKKQELLEYQRQMALQRLQQQEQEMLMKQEMMKQEMMKQQQQQQQFAAMQHAMQWGGAPLPGHGGPNMMYNPAGVPPMQNYPPPQYPMPGVGTTFSPEGSPAHRSQGNYQAPPNYAAPAAYGAPPPTQAPYMASQPAPYYPNAGPPPAYATAGAPPPYGQDPNAAYAPPYSAPPPTGVQPSYNSAPASVASAPGTDSQGAYNMAPMYNALPPNGQYGQQAPPPAGGYMQPPQASQYPPVPGQVPPQGQAPPQAPGGQPAQGAAQDAAQLICFD